MDSRKARRLSENWVWVGLSLGCAAMDDGVERRGKLRMKTAFSAVLQLLFPLRLAVEMAMRR